MIIGVISSSKSLFQFIRSNLRSNGYIDMKNPRVNVLGFTQPETLLKFWKLSDGDAGGKFERFIFTAPPKVRKDMRAEAEVDFSDVVPLIKVVWYPSPPHI